MLYRLGLTACALALLATEASADGMLFPVERPHTLEIVRNRLFTVKYHHVNVTIVDQLCTTKVDQVFHNDSSADREGIYIFPMPEGSAITKFSMYAGEDEIKGRILDRKEARAIYESIVRQRKDPALLEYIDRNTFRASVYPIPANGDKRIRLIYAEVAGKSGRTCRYVYPLSTERFSAKPLEDCKITIRIKSKRAISNIYSPTHVVNVDHTGANEATVTWQARDARPDTDMVLYYTVSDDDLGIDLIAHRETGEKGYYMLLASPRVDADKTKVLPKNVVFVLDRTGSMAGEKIEQAKEALKFCLNSLKPEDEFNVITFNESPVALFSGMRKATSENRIKAVNDVASIDATGGTNIAEALAKALAEFRGGGSSRNYIVFLTDGQPTVGDTNPESIVKKAAEANRNKVRVFAFGVGYDVNTHLLDKLAEQSKGDADYVRPRENIEVKVSSFFAKVSDPLLSDVNLTITGVTTSDAFPSGELPDMFRGTQLIIFGRYEGSGEATIELSGVANGSRKTFRVRAELPEREALNEFIPQLWASRKIGYLLDEIRLHSNQELIDEVVRLSKEYGIPTEYTSFFADDRNLVVNSADAVRRAKELAEAAHKTRSGSYGVAQSANTRVLRNQAQLPASVASPGPDGYGGYAASANTVGKVAANGRAGGAYLDANDQLVVVANVQNIAGRTFYQRGNFWEDSGVRDNQKFTQVKQFSDAHFALLRAYPKLSQYSTLGNVRLVLETARQSRSATRAKRSSRTRR